MSAAIHHADAGTFDAAAWDALPEAERARGNVHPTVKHLDLASWLVRLVTPPGGRPCDPFCGSGSIPVAATLAGFDVIAGDLSPEAVDIARARLAYWSGTGTEPTRPSAPSIVTVPRAPIVEPAQRSLFALA